MAIEALIPSPVYRIFERPDEVMMRRPKAISSPGTPDTDHVIKPTATAEAARVATPILFGDLQASAASTTTPATAEPTMSKRSAFCVPIQGIKRRLKPRAPRIAPPVLAA